MSQPNEAKMRKEIPSGNSLANIIALASEKHKAQLDKGGNPYILHCFRVMTAVMARLPDDIDTKLKENI